MIAPALKGVIAAALVAAAPLAAGADTCPTNADVQNGVRLTRADPFFSIVQTQTPEGLAEARVMQRDGQKDAVSSLFEHPLAVIRRIGSNGTLELHYGADTMILDTLPSLDKWSTSVSLVSNGETINRGEYSVRLIDVTQAQVGNCAYDVWRIEDSLALSGSEPLRFEKSYAPDLGLVLSSIRLDAQGDPISGVLFDEIAAE